MRAWQFIQNSTKISILCVCLLHGLYTQALEISESKVNQQSMVDGKDAESDSILYQSDEVKIKSNDKNLLDNMPEYLSRKNQRFITVASENDYFGDGSDKDFTNGGRITYLNTGSSQPFYVRWIDDLLPMFSINQTTSTYYSIGHNLYTPNDIKKTIPDPKDRPYAAFLYASTGLSTITDSHSDNVEVTFGVVGPYALGKEVQTEYHRLKGATIPQGWNSQLHNELGLMLSWERTWLELIAIELSDSLFIRTSSHLGATLGNIYTYANTGLTINITPSSGKWQAKPVRVRPAIPGSGLFEATDNRWSWMLFAGFDSRLMVYNIFLDGNSYQDSPRVKKLPFALDFSAGAAVTFDHFRLSYTINWRRKEFDSPLAKRQVFGAITMGYHF